MNWIKKHDNWLGKKAESSKLKAERAEKQVLTVTEAAVELGVDKQTIRKYLALDPEDEAPIPFDAWYRLPGGHIRIYQWIIVKIKTQNRANDYSPLQNR